MSKYVAALVAIGVGWLITQDVYKTVFPRSSAVHCIETQKATVKNFAACRVPVTRWVKRNGGEEVARYLFKDTIATKALIGAVGRKLERELQ